MEPTTPANSIPVPSITTESGNAILSAFLDASTPIEHIAQEFSLTVSSLLAWLKQHQQLIVELTSTLEQRAKLLALRAEVIAMDTLRQIAELSRDPEARRKAASKLLSHVKPPSPRPAGRSVARAACDDEGPSTCSTIECSPASRATNVAGSAASLVQPTAHSTTQAIDAASPPLHAESVAVSSSAVDHSDTSR